MASCPDDVPWWRVVAKSGHCPIGKRSPALAKTQEELLTEEGVELVNGRVNMRLYECAEEELDLLI